MWYLGQYAYIQTDRHHFKKQLFWFKKDQKNTFTLLHIQRFQLQKCFLYTINWEQNKGTSKALTQVHSPLSFGSSQ